METTLYSNGSNDPSGSDDPYDFGNSGKRNPAPTRHFVPRLLGGALLVLWSVFAAGAANAQANLTFSGANGTPLTITLLTPITYTVTAPTSEVNFVLKGVGDYSITYSPGATNLTYRVNGGAATPITTYKTGGVGGAVSSQDVIFYGANVPLVVGNTVTLSAGTFTTDGNFGAETPANGSYTTFIATNTGTQISTNGASATASPEPASLALVGVGGVGMVGMIVRRKRA